MKRSLSRTALLTTALGMACAVPGLRAQAEQVGRELAAQLPPDTAEAVRHALGLMDAPAAPVPRAATTPAAAATTATQTSGPASTTTASTEAPSQGKAPEQEQQIRAIMGFAPLPATALKASGASPDAALDTHATQRQASAPVAATGPAIDTAAMPQGQAPAGATTPASERTGVAGVAPAQAARTPVPPMGFPANGQTVAAIDEGLLDSMRGGFTSNGGLQISFGIERAVYVNGSLVTTTSLNLSELGTLSAGKAASLSLPDVGTRLAWIQSGAGNTLLSNLGPAAIGTVIQNTLDGQNIQTRTVINATVNSLSVLKSLDLQRNLRNATTDALRR